jgi:hypothetical protein
MKFFILGWLARVSIYLFKSIYSFINNMIMTLDDREGGRGLRMPKTG